VGQVNGYLSGVDFRPSCVLAKSAVVADSCFEGYFNTFNLYQYALSAEAVKAHSSVDRPPFYAIVFDTNLQVRTGATGYSWQSVDTVVVN
jgi:hypothetical protein